MKNMIDIEANMRESVGFRQRDIYGHYQTSSWNAVDPYLHDDKIFALVKYQSLRTKEEWKQYRKSSESVLSEYSETFKGLSDITPMKKSFGSFTQNLKDKLQKV